MRLSRPDFEEIVLSAWNLRSEGARKRLSCTLDIRYGEGARQLLDVYTCGDPSAPTLVYFHGGYWKSGDKSIYSFLAEPFVDASVNVVIVGYDLCPEVTLTQICEQAREAIAAIYNEHAELGINPDRVTVMGHSAGGHLTQIMIATDWSSYQKDLPAQLIKSAIAISPISYLEPIRLTESVNASIGLDAAEAESQSPMVNHPPCTNAPVLLLVGAAETEEFHRQAQMYADAFTRTKRKIELCLVPEVDHFDVLNTLANPKSGIFQKAITLIS